MLRIYSFIVDTLKVLGPVLREIARHDIDLARQARRAASSIALNTAEAYGCSGGHERMRFRTALGSAHEVKACLDVAEALAYVDAVDADLRDRLDRIAATSTASLRDEAVEHGADDAEVGESLLVDLVEVAEGPRHIEAGFRLLRGAERHLVERLPVATSRIAPFGDVERDARKRPPKLPTEVEIASANGLDARPQPSNYLE
jgi:four helix bundle protein